MVETTELRKKFSRLKICKNNFKAGEMPAFYYKKLLNFLKQNNSENEIVRHTFIISNIKMHKNAK